MGKIVGIWFLLTKINPIKTFYFNLKYFDLNTALRFPVFIYWRTKLYQMGGQIVLNAPISRGMIKIGPYGLGTQDMKYSRTIWQVSGKLIVNGNIVLGRGSRVSIGHSGILILGDRFNITGRSTVICQKSIEFGDNCLLSWDILIMDVDMHKIMDLKGSVSNYPKPIRVGKHVWIGCRSTILKGVTLPDNIVIAAGSVISKSVNDSNCVVGNDGRGLAVLKKDIQWVE